MARRQVVAVGLVDRDQVGELDQALLDALQLVAGAGQQQDQEKVDHAGDHRLGLADTHRLDQDHVEARRLAQQHGLARHPRDAAQRARRGRRADVGRGVDGEARHAGLVAQDRAAGAAARRVDGQHGHAVAGRGEQGAEGVDEGALADAGHAGDADALRVAGVRQQRWRTRLGPGLVLGPGALDQRDGAGEEVRSPLRTPAASAAGSGALTLSQVVQPGELPTGRNGASRTRSQSQSWPSSATGWCSSPASAIWRSPRR